MLKEKETSEPLYPRHAGSDMPAILPSDYEAYVDRKSFRADELKLCKPYYEKAPEPQR